MCPPRREQSRPRAYRFTQHTRDVRNLRSRRYRQLNPHRFAVYAARSRAKGYQAISTLTPDEWLENLEAAGYRCQICGIQAEDTTLGHLTLDHARPYSLGGANEQKNCIPVCLPCNESKSGNWYDYSVRPPRLVQRYWDPTTIRIPHPRSKLAQLAKQAEGLARAKLTGLVVNVQKEETFSVEELLC